MVKSLVFFFGVTALIFPLFLFFLNENSNDLTSLTSSLLLVSLDITGSAGLYPINSGRAATDVSLIPFKSLSPLLKLTELRVKHDSKPVSSSKFSIFPLSDTNLMFISGLDCASFRIPSNSPCSYKHSLSNTTIKFFKYGIITAQSSLS